MGILEAIAPGRIYIDSTAKFDTLTDRVLTAFPNAEICSLEQQGDPAFDPQGRVAAKDSFARGKRELVLTRYQGEWLKACPGTSDHVCCNLWIVNPGEGCPMDCTYCYLQSYLRRNPTLKLYTNTDDLAAAIVKKTAEFPTRLFRIGTGEVIDSLVWDSVTELSRELVPLFGRLPNAVLELKTKTAEVETLLELQDQHCGNTVVSWSVNAESITSADEAYTAPLEERIRAAQAVAKAGYRVGLHFDPVIHFSGWEEEYQRAVEQIFTRVPKQAIAWVSVSTLRYKPEMHEIMRERFPASKLPYGEQFLGRDGKMRYFQPLRLKLVRYVWELIKQRAGEVPVYMCMESSTAWRSIHGGSPAAGQELVEIFSRKRSRKVARAQA